MIEKKALFPIFERKSPKIKEKPNTIFSSKKVSIASSHNQHTLQATIDESLISLSDRKGRALQKVNFTNVPRSSSKACTNESNTEYLSTQNREFQKSIVLLPKKDCSRSHETKAHKYSLKQPKMNKCEYCPYSFTTNDVLQKHILNRHSSQFYKPFKCPLCIKSYAHHNTRHTHLRTVHKLTLNQVQSLNLNNRSLK